MADAMPALLMEDIRKSFGAVTVLKGITFDVFPGEVHALLGENGAGKSTLMKILMGIHPPTSGRYLVGGQEVNFASPSEAQKNRVSMVYQEFGLVPHLSVTENILIGRLPTRLGIVDWAKARETARSALEQVGSSVDPKAMVEDLKVADQQEVEIARALSYDPLIYVMDEPSAALSRAEIESLYKLVRMLQDRGVAIVYISHKLEEVLDLADRVTILRDGVVAGTHAVADLTTRMIVEEMTGRTVEDVQSAEARPVTDDAEPLLELRHLSYPPFFEDLNLTVPKGKIVGVAGVIGAGKTEIAQVVFGSHPPNATIEGDVVLAGEPIPRLGHGPNKARALGIGFVGEDRKAEGFVAGQSVSFNTVLPALKRVSSIGYLLSARLKSLVQTSIDQVRLRPAEPNKLMDELSGGNQQKVVIAKWLAAGSQLILLDEPTRGIDVGARQEIYDLMRQQAAENGTGVLLLSSDMREILLASDEIYVIVQGRITRRMSPSDTTEHELIEMTLVRGERQGNGASSPHGEAARVS